MTLEQLLTTLEAAGTVPAGTATRAEALLAGSAPQTPWFVHLLLAGAAWFAMALTLVTLIGLELIDDEVSAAVAGLLLIAGALALRYSSEMAFTVQVALAMSLAGITLVSFSAGSEFRAEGVGYVLMGVGALLLFVYPDSLHRFLCVLLSALGASIAAYASEAMTAASLITVALGAASAWVWLRDDATPRDWPGRHRRALGYGLVVALIGTVAPSALAGSIAGAMPVPITDLSTAGLACVLLAAAVRVAKRLHEPLVSPRLLIPLGLAVLVAALTSSAPGITCALLIAVLGQHREDRLLIGLGVACAVVFLSAYYYQLHVSLLTKSISLLAAGLAMVLTRAVIHWRARHA